MDSEETDFQNQGFALTGEETYLHPFSHPLLWNDDFSLTDGGPHFVARCDSLNVWSEAASSESVEMLLNSVEKDEFLERERLARDCQVGSSDSGNAQNAPTVFVPVVGPNESGDFVGVSGERELQEVPLDETDIIGNIHSAPMVFSVDNLDADCQVSPTLPGNENFVDERVEREVNEFSLDETAIIENGHHAPIVVSDDYLARDCQVGPTLQESENFVGEIGEREVHEVPLDETNTTGNTQNSPTILSGDSLGTDCQVGPTALENEDSVVEREGSPAVVSVDMLNSDCQVGPTVLPFENLVGEGNKNDSDLDSAVDGSLGSEAGETAVIGNTQNDPAVLSFCNVDTDGQLGPIVPSCESDLSSETVYTAIIGDTENAPGVLSDDISDTDCQVGPTVSACEKILGESDEKELNTDPPDESLSYDDVGNTENAPDGDSQKGPDLTEIPLISNIGETVGNTQNISTGFSVGNNSGTDCKILSAEGSLGEQLNSEMEGPATAVPSEVTKDENNSKNAPLERSEIEVQDKVESEENLAVSSESVEDKSGHSNHAKFDDSGLNQEIGTEHCSIITESSGENVEITIGSLEEGCVYLEDERENGFNIEKCEEENDAENITKKCEGTEKNDCGAYSATDETLISIEHERESGMEYNEEKIADETTEKEVETSPVETTCGAHSSADETSISTEHERENGMECSELNIAEMTTEKLEITTDDAEGEMVVSPEEMSCGAHDSADDALMSTDHVKESRTEFSEEENITEKSTEKLEITDNATGEELEVSPLRNTCGAHDSTGEALISMEQKRENGMECCEEEKISEKTTEKLEISTDATEEEMEISPVENGCGAHDSPEDVLIPTEHERENGTECSEQEEITTETAEKLEITIDDTEGDMESSPVEINCGFHGSADEALIRTENVIENGTECGEEGKFTERSTMKLEITTDATGEEIEIFPVKNGCEPQRENSDSGVARLSLASTDKSDDNQRDAENITEKCEMTVDATMGEQEISPVKNSLVNSGLICVEQDGENGAKGENGTDSRVPQSSSPSIEKNNGEEKSAENTTEKCEIMSDATEGELESSPVRNSLVDSALICVEQERENEAKGKSCDLRVDPSMEKNDAENTIEKCEIMSEATEDKMEISPVKGSCGAHSSVGSGSICAEQEIDNSSVSRVAQLSFPSNEKNSGEKDAEKSTECKIMINAIGEETELSPVKSSCEAHNLPEGREDGTEVVNSNCRFTQLSLPYRENSIKGEEKDCEMTSNATKKEMEMIPLVQNSGKRVEAVKVQTEQSLTLADHGSVELSGSEQTVVGLGPNTNSMNLECSSDKDKRGAPLTNEPGKSNLPDLESEKTGDKPSASVSDRVADVVPPEKMAGDESGESHLLELDGERASSAVPGCISPVLLKLVADLASQEKLTQDKAGDALIHQLEVSQISTLAESNSKSDTEEIKKGLSESKSKSELGMNKTKSTVQDSTDSSLNGLSSPSELEKSSKGKNVKCPTLPDLNTCVPSGAPAQQTFFPAQQTFMPTQQVQLRAQIFVYGSLAQGFLPNENYMETAFGESERSTWVGVWHTIAEKIKKQRANFSLYDTPSHSGSRYTEHLISSPQIQSINKFLSPRGALFDFSPSISPFHAYFSSNSPPQYSPYIYPYPWLLSPQIPAFNEVSQVTPAVTSNKPKRKRGLPGSVILRANQVTPHGPFSAENSGSKKNGLFLEEAGPTAQHALTNEFVPRGITPASSGNTQETKPKPEPSCATAIVSGGDAVSGLRVDWAKLRPEEALKQCQEIWNHLTAQNKSGLWTEIDARLAAAEAAAASARAAAEAARLASESALHAKLLADEILESSLMGLLTSGTIKSRDDADAAMLTTPARVLKGRDGANDTIIMSAAREASRRRVRAAAVASRIAENFDEILRSAELAAEAVSQVGLAVTMGDPLPFSMSDLVERASAGFHPIDSINGEIKNDSEKDKKGENDGEKDKTGEIDNEKDKKGEIENEKYKTGEIEREKYKKSEIESEKDKKGQLDLQLENGLTENEPVDLQMTSVTANTGEDGSGRNGGESSIKTGSLVEVMMSEKDGFRGAWFTARVLEIKASRAYVCYTDLLSSEGSSQLKEWVPLESESGEAPRIRAAHSISVMKLEGNNNKKRRREIEGSYNNTWSVGDSVDAWIRNGWREGVIAGKNQLDETEYTVRFSGGSDLSVVSIWNLRPPLVWRDGIWIECIRSNKGDSPFMKRQKVGPTESVTCPKIGTNGTNPNESRTLSLLSTKERSFTIGKNPREEGASKIPKITRIGLQNDGPRVVFGIPKPNKKMNSIEGAKRSENPLKFRKSSNDSIETSSSRAPSRTLNYKGSNVLVKGDNKGKISTEHNNSRAPSKTLNYNNASGNLSKKRSHESIQLEKGAKGNSASHTSKNYIVTTEYNNSRAHPKRLGYRGDSKLGNKRLNELAELEKGAKGKPSFTSNLGRTPKKENNNQNVESAELRRSNRRIRPTSKLLEGMQSSLVMGNLPPLSLETFGIKDNNKGASSSKGTTRK